MGYGLVAVPRQLWRTADIKGAEKASYHKAGLQAEKAIAAKKYFAALRSPHALLFCLPQHSLLAIINFMG